MILAEGKIDNSDINPLRMEFFLETKNKISRIN